jgi:hypothetical protein
VLDLRSKGSDRLAPTTALYHRGITIRTIKVDVVMHGPFVGAIFTF